MSRSGIIQTAVAAIAGVAVCIGLESSYFSKSGSDNNVSYGSLMPGNKTSNDESGNAMVDMILDETVKITNAACPKTIDGETRLDSTSKQPGAVLAEYFTLTNTSRNADVEGIRQRLTTSLINNIKSQESLKVLRDGGVTFSFIYRSKEGVPLFNINVGPAQYN